MKIEKEILYRFFNGDATLKEEEEVRAFIESSPENWEVYLSERRLYDTMILRNSTIHNTKKYRFHFKLWFGWGSTAACILFMGLAVYYSVNKSSSDLLDAVATLRNAVDIESAGIQLITPLGKTIIVSDSSRLISNEGDGSIRIDDESVTEMDQTSIQKGSYNQIVVPLGKHIRLALSDGSVVEVNSGTKVVYPRIFSNTQREIYVEGEIFIDVKPINQIPFIVRTDQFDVNVLGTSFNVRAYPEDIAAEVVLQRGVVEVKDHANKIITMKPDELVVLREGEYVEKKAIDVANYVAWKEGLLIFNGESMIEVVQRLNRFYGLKFCCDKEIEQKNLYGKLDIDEPIEKALSAISATAGIGWKVEKGIYRFYRVK